MRVLASIHTRRQAIEETKRLETKVNGRKASIKPSADPAGEEVGG
jgi:hypothetical protein